MKLYIFYKLKMQIFKGKTTKVCWHLFSRFLCVCGATHVRTVMDLLSYPGMSSTTNHTLNWDWWYLEYYLHTKSIAGMISVPHGPRRKVLRESGPGFELKHSMYSIREQNYEVLLLGIQDMERVWLPFGCMPWHKREHNEVGLHLVILWQQYLYRHLYNVKLQFLFDYV